MDLFNDKPPKATVKQKLFRGEDVRKTDLVTVEKQNAAQSKIKVRPTSKYKSGNTQLPTSRSSSPSFIKKSSITDIPVSMRAQSTERKSLNATSLKSSSAPSSPLRRSPWHSTPPSSVCDGNAEKQNPSRRAFGGRTTDGLWPSKRSLSSSFHSESFICASKKDRPVTSASLDHTLKNTTKAISERKRSPLTGRNTSQQSENSSLMQGVHSRVVDQRRWPAMKGGKLSTMELSRSMNMTDRIEKATSLMLRSRGLSPTTRIPMSDGIDKSVHKSRIVNVASRHVEEEKALPSTNPRRTLSVPMVALRHPSSSDNASVQSSSASKRTSSLSSSRPSTPFISPNNSMNRIGASSLVPSHVLDIRKAIKGADMEDIHQLRLLYNRELQWRYVNSQAEVALANQKIVVESICNNVWNVTSELQDLVTMEKINFESLKQEMKLEMLLKEQAPYLEDWIELEKEYFTSLYGTIEALKASLLRLPVTSGARVDVRAVKNAISSAIDVMQAMGSSVYSLLSKVEDTKRLSCQLSAVAVKEKATLDECRVLLAAAAGMQVEECSLRAHILQQLKQDIADKIR